MISFFERIKALGWAYGEKLTSAQQSTLDSRLRTLMSNQVDDWVQNWTSSTLGGFGGGIVRLTSGLTISGGQTGTANTIHYGVDINPINTSFTLTPSVGTFQMHDCAGLGRNAMFLGQNTSDPTKAVFTIDDANIQRGQIERTLTGAVAGDYAGFAWWCVTDPVDGYFYVFSGVAARKSWSSPDAGTWTARAAATGVTTLATDRPVVANNGFIIVFGQNGSAVGQFSYSSDRGATWTTTTIGGSEPIVRMDWSPTLSLWIAVGTKGRVWTSATPGGTFALSNVVFSTTGYSIESCAIVDGVIVGVYNNAIIASTSRPGVVLIYSLDLGVTWKVTAIDPVENSGYWKVFFDNQRLWLRGGAAGGVLYKTKAIGNGFTITSESEIND